MSPSIHNRDMKFVGLVVFIISVGCRLGWTYGSVHGANFVDLHVYVGGGQALIHPGQLYRYTYSDQTPDFPLPFTYPPFAAIIFYPLGLVPFRLVGALWQVGMIAAIVAIVRLSQQFICAQHRSWRSVLAWSAMVLWIEPVRSSFDYGQINIFLVLAILYGAYSQQWWISGVLFGLATGIKLTPGIGFLYLAGMRRWYALTSAIMIFSATILLSWCVTQDQTWHYFHDLLGDAHRVGPVASSFNQSWRGTLSRILGHDVGYGPLVIIAFVLTAGIAFCAWRQLWVFSDGHDRLGLLIIVELFGLVVSPISWTHHWIWIIPLLIWLFEGPYSSMAMSRILGWIWVIVTGVGIPWLLSFTQPSIWCYERPWYLAWAGSIYVVMVLVTLGWIAFLSPRRDDRKIARLLHRAKKFEDHDRSAIL